MTLADDTKPTAARTEVSPSEVRTWVQEGRAVLVDVREPDEHARERIDGARLMPLSAFDPQEAAALAGHGQIVVFHCKSGRRSADAFARATSCGVPAANMTGGIDGWKQAGLPVEVNTRVSRISIMRQVQLVVGLGVLTGSALGAFVHVGFIGLAAFFGAGLTFAGATGTCMLASLLAKMPWNRAA